MSGSKINAVIGALLESWRNFQFKFDSTSEAFKGDKLNTSDIREVTVKEFVEMCFPLPYRVTKGQIYALNGESNNIDCVLLAPNHPKLSTPLGRDVILAEGVYSAIEVKPDIQNSAEFNRGLTQIKSVKLLHREIAELRMSGEVSVEFKQIPCVIFSNKSKNNWLDTIKQMCNFVHENNANSSVLPAVTVALDRGIIFHSTHIENSMFTNWANKIAGGHVVGGDFFITIDCFGEQLLGALLLIMLSFTPPEPLFAEPILKRYLLSSSGLAQSVKYSVYPFLRIESNE